HEHINLALRGVGGLTGAKSKRFASATDVGNLALRLDRIGGLEYQAEWCSQPRTFELQWPQCRAVWIVDGRERRRSRCQWLIYQVQRAENRRRREQGKEPVTPLPPDFVPSH